MLVRVGRMDNGDGTETPVYGKPDDGKGTQNADGVGSDTPGGSIAT